MRHVQFEGRGPIFSNTKTKDEPRETVSTSAESSMILGSNTFRKRHLVELTLSSRDVIDYDLDSTKLAYLTKKGIDLFLVSNPKSSPESEQLQIDHRWHGIKVAEPYIVVWGSRLSHGRESAVSLYTYF